MKEGNLALTHRIWTTSVDSTTCMWTRIVFDVDPSRWFAYWMRIVSSSYPEEPTSLSKKRKVKSQMLSSCFLKKVLNSLTLSSPPLVLCLSEKQIYWFYFWDHNKILESLFKFRCRWIRISFVWCEDNSSRRFRRTNESLCYARNKKLKFKFSSQNRTSSVLTVSDVDARSSTTVSLARWKADSHEMWWMFEIFFPSVSTKKQCILITSEQEKITWLERLLHRTIRHRKNKRQWMGVFLILLERKRMNLTTLPVCPSYLDFLSLHLVL
jgi:hypothetical protein